MKRYVRNHPEYDAIFVPTVSVHHLLAWARLIKGTLRHRKTRVLLFFLTAPARVDSAGGTISDTSASARLLLALVKWLAPEVRDGKVVLGVETKAIQKAFEHLTGLPFVWFPQPVAPHVRNPISPDKWIKMACFGAARAEKGSDVLQDAVKLHRRDHPSSRVRFTIQWVEDFNAGGRLMTKSSELQGDGKVRFVTRYFRNEEYAEHLRQTDVMLLPYRLSSYALRGSRVVIEAAVNGIPVVATRGTTLAGVAQEFGTGIFCNDGDPQSVLHSGAIARKWNRNSDEMSRRAEGRQKPPRLNFFRCGNFVGFSLILRNLCPPGNSQSSRSLGQQARDGCRNFCMNLRVMAGAVLAYSYNHIISRIPFHFLRLWYLKAYLGGIGKGIWPCKCLVVFKTGERFFLASGTSLTLVACLMAGGSTSKLETTSPSDQKRPS